jgi:Domain of unknown function (DUF4136)
MNGGMPMKTGFRFSLVVPAILTFMIIGGCCTPIRDTVSTYSYGVSFPELKTYQWAKTTVAYRQDSLLEGNVRFLADRALEAKGLTSKTDKPDLLIGISYSLEYPSYGYGYGFGCGYGYGYELRRLTLNISRAHDNELIWRGMATWNIRTDATSDDLRQAVEKILVNFPPSK